ncbi:ribulose bisphosphate carboxylase small subunit [Rhodovibrio salinarum]|uniref:Ribulose bisphosphate carboxylase small subunit n=1 Tax=Rhodovibrio salinarum TaxID=1087 RepID=A0A934QFS2_9PROT|nr:ribulose bisphosphate carboxylase small subunit [Rhodovibrio salinarum]MBK1696181.1 ribulose bisphosphate carboxylase small subunit [Rhodovibrio salinarum]
MRLTQGTFSFLPDLSDDQIYKQVQYAIDNGWAVSLEYTDDPHPRNTYWEIWNRPMFDNPDAQALIEELKEARAQFPNYYIRIVAFDNSHGWEAPRLSFIAHRPPEEPGFRLERMEGPQRRQHFSLQPYASAKPTGQRYKSAK